MPLTSAVGRAPSRSSVENPASPRSARDLATAEEVGVAFGHLGEQRALFVGQLDDVVVEPGHLHPSVVVVQLGDETGDLGRRVGHGAAEHAGVQVEVGAVEGHLAHRHAAHAGDGARHVLGDHPGVGDDDDVGVEPVAPLGQQRLEVRRAGLLLALDEELQRDRRGRCARSRRGARAGRAGGTAADPCRRTRRGRAARRRRRSGRTGRCARARAGRPAARRDGRRRARRARRRRRWAIRRRPRAARRSARSRRSGSRCAAARAGEPLAAAHDVGVVLGLRADARDPQPGVEVGQQFVAVFGHEVAY